MLDEVIADFLGDWPPYQAVLRLPGIGPVLAAVVIAEIGDVSRFPGPGQLCSWAGLTPRHRESDLKDGIIDRRGKEARNIAKVAAARKLLTCVFYAMRDGEVRSLTARSQAREAG